MKRFLILALFALTASASLPFDDDATRINGENGWYIPQIDGSFEWVDMEETEKKMEQLKLQEGRGLSTNPVTFYLYTNQNPKKSQTLTESTKSINKSNFDVNNPTRFVIHGWTQSKSSSMNKVIRNAWLSRGDYNVIYVAWARAISVDYASSVAAVPGVGQKVASMINYLNKNFGMSMDTLEVVGHSLGAHVAGYAGKNTKQQIHTIVGLDPALPLFSYTSPKKRLNADDAYYVESIQTDGGQLGFLQPIGKGAFYPNGGKSQPGCAWDLTGACSHERSVSYYAEAVEKNDFPTYRCKNYVDAVNDECGSSYSTVRMGAISNSMMVDGTYYVPVKSSSPYGYGS